MLAFVVVVGYYNVSNIMSFLLYFREKYLKMSKKVKKTYFQESWLSNNEFKEWLVAAADKTQAKCKLCKATFTLGNMGMTALKSHATGKGHRKKVIKHKEIQNFFAKRQNVSKSSTDTTCELNEDLTATKDTVTSTANPDCSNNSQSTITEKFLDD